MYIAMGYISTLIIPTIMSTILLIGLKEKKKVYDIFTSGVKEGIKVTISLFPTLIGVFLAISMLRNSGLIDFISSIISNLINVPSEILPLALIKPISGSGAMALATDIMTKFGPDSKIGMIAGTIMGSSETTFYVIALYMSKAKVKDSRGVVIPALLADLASIISAIVFYLYF